MSDEKLSEIDQLWKEFEYRHHLYWDLVTKFTIAISFFITIPFIYAKEYDAVKNYSYIFPLCALVMSLVAAKILKTEAELMALPHSLYREAMTSMLGCKNYKSLSNGEYKNRIKRLSIAILLQRLFLFIGPLVSLASILAIYSTNVKS